MIISETWKFIHGAEPPANCHRAAEAAEAYWRAAGGDPHSVGEEPLARWRYHFELARDNKVKTITAEYRRHLVENERSWKLLHGFSEEAAQRDGKPIEPQGAQFFSLPQPTKSSHGWFDALNRHEAKALGGTPWIFTVMLGARA